MKKLLFTTILTLFLFSCKGNGPNPAPINNTPNPEKIVPNPDPNSEFSGDYDDLLTLELASRITGFEPSLARKTHILKGMAGEILRYNWENGRTIVKEKSASNRKRTESSLTDIVEIKWVDGEADLESFMDYVNLEKYPEKTKANSVDESAYWNPTKEHLEVYYNGVSFTLKIDISDDVITDKEKTIALAKLIVTEKL